MSPSTRPPRRGFSIVELLMVVAVIGVLSAIIIPNLLTAIQRSKQKRTMADIRAIAIAWEAYGVDKGRYNSPAWTPLPAIAATDLTPALVPTFAKSLPAADGWRRPFRFGAGEDWGATAPATSYQIASGGRNGTLETGSAGMTTHYDCDIVWESGTFVVWPEGVQSEQ